MTPAQEVHYKQWIHSYDLTGGACTTAEFVSMELRPAIQSKHKIADREAQVTEVLHHFMGLAFTAGWDARWSHLSEVLQRE